MKQHNDVVPRTRAKRGSAIHEAGHAVVALYFGHEVGTVHVLPRATEAGSARTRPGRGFHADVPLVYFLLQEEIIVCMAGREAECFYLQNAGQPFENHDFGDQADMAQARRNLEEMNDLFAEESAETVLSRLREVTQDTIEYLWGSISAVAEELLARQKLEPEEVKRVFARTMRGGPFRGPLIQSR